MSSTLYQSDHLAPVISLRAARAQRSAQADPGDTLMVRLVLVSDDAVYRWVGIHEHTTIKECRGVVATVFGIEGEVGAEAADSLELGEVLRTTGDATSFAWGLWQFGAQLADVYPRDRSTPPSVCVAGSGAFGDRPFDIGRVNAQLLGAERARRLEQLVRADAREVIGRASTHDFVPLIQALGVDRDTGARAGSAAALARLPLEDEPRARDAFWACVLADACCADDAVTDRLTESIMESLGWRGMGAAEVRACCAASLARLDALAADLPLAGRLDVYRDLLRG